MADARVVNSMMAPSSTPTESALMPGNSEYNSRSQRGEGTVPVTGFEPRDEYSVPDTTIQMDVNEEVFITSIRATSVVPGLGRLPAGFYVAVHHSGLEWRTENKRSFVSEDVVEWAGLIPIPSDVSADVWLEVYASFELQPMISAGELLRRLKIKVEQLLDRSVRDVTFTFFPRDGDVVSPCSSISIAVERRGRRTGDLSTSIVLDPCSNAKSHGELEDATIQGHNALLRYRKYRERRELERSIEQFTLALDICPLDHPGRAAAQSNLAMAKFVLCQAEDKDASFGELLRLYGNALSTRPVGHVDRPFTLIQLATVHLVLFERRGDEIEGVRAKAWLHEAMQLSCADSHENRVARWMLLVYVGRVGRAVQREGQSAAERDSMFINDLVYISAHLKLGRPEGLVLSDRIKLSIQLLGHFKRFGDLADLEQGITMLKKVVESISAQYPVFRAVLGAALFDRFERLGEPSDLEDAISHFKTFSDLVPDSHPDKPSALHNLGSSFRVRFEWLGELRDLEEAISTQKAAIHLTPDSHPGRSAYLNGLGNSFLSRFKCLGALKDLEAAISTHKASIDLMPDSHPDKPICLNNLGVSFFARFDRLGELGDLEEGISTLKAADHLTPDGHPNKPGRLNNLGNSFRIRFKCLGGLSDLEESISTQKAAVHCTPDGHPDKFIYLGNLGESFIARFERLGELNDLELGISTQKAAIRLMPDSYFDKPALLDNFGRCLVARFRRLGEMSDLQEAISTLKAAVSLTPDSHPNKPKYLCSLGTCFITCFEHLRESVDLDEAISALKAAIHLTPDSHPRKSVYLNNLGVSFQNLFGRVGELSDLEEAISTLKAAYHLTSDGHPDKPHRLQNLGNSFIARFECLGELGDTEEAVSTYKAAIRLTPNDHPDQSHLLSGLGVALSARFRCLGELSDLEDAISTLMTVIHIIPDGQFYKPAYLGNLGLSFRSRFECLGELSDLEHAISAYAYAASSPFGSLRHRFHASRGWISSARRIHHQSLLRAYSVAIHLLPQLAWIGLSLEQRFSQLAQGTDLVREAAAAALDSGFPELAVEWLEQGRSIVWGELLQLRSSHEDLFSAHPDRACKLRELSAQLEHASVVREQSMSTLVDASQSTIHHSPDPLQQQDEQRRLAVARDKLLQEIRRLPGFSQFLLQKEFSQLRASAHSGPVVMLNAAESRCDALVVLANVDHVIHVPLSQFNFKRSSSLQNVLEKLLGHARDFRFDEREGKSATLGGVSWESLLHTLWKDVVKPVLDALAFSTPGDLSRIFWCPTGPFTFLPLHAAGLYGIQQLQPGHKVSDFVVSSYVPNLSILAPTSNPTILPNGDVRLLVVRQPPSDGLSKLPGVITESECIRAIMRESRTTLVEPSVGTVEEVAELMKEADWVHFACHGIQDGVNSGLCLADRRRLRVRDIMGLSSRRRGLAFLSACQTAMGEEGLADEAIHVAAGMLFAGFGGVIGTMWSISDKLAPRVAKDVYEQLFRNGTKPDHLDAARALHEVIGRVRDSGRASFATWLPFIHVGL